jgi:hypothetical protein
MGRLLRRARHFPQRPKNSRTHGTTSEEPEERVLHFVGRKRRGAGGSADGLDVHELADQPTA